MLRKENPRTIQLPSGTATFTEAQIEILVSAVKIYLAGEHERATDLAVIYRQSERRPPYLTEVDIKRAFDNARANEDLAQEILRMLDVSDAGV